MAYDEDLAHRVRELLGAQDGLSEMSMFGGLAFLLDGNMSVAVSSQGGLLVRVGSEEADAALSRPHARAMQMRGRTMRGWIRVQAEGLQTRRQLALWVGKGVDFARTLPAKGSKDAASG
jgi:TfoX/Sxy family transcriptional regulator of competence genes